MSQAAPVHLPFSTWECKPPQLPEPSDIASARASVEGNPANAPRLEGRTVLGIAAAGLLSPAAIAGLTGRMWPAGRLDLSVQFLDGTDRQTQDKILVFANNWGAPGRGNVRFRLTNSTGQIRVVTTGERMYASYIGRDCEQIPPHLPTMWLWNFHHTRTPLSEFYRVVEHEFGHAMGFVHEHARAEIVRRLDREAVYEWAKRTQGWGRGMTDAQILTPLDERTLTTTATEEGSIMGYDFAPELTLDRRGIRGGARITDRDASLAAKLWPQEVAPSPPTPPPPSPPSPPTPALTTVQPFDVGGGTVFWREPGGRQVSVQPFPGWTGEVRIATDGKFVGCVPGPGGGPLVAFYHARTGRPTVPPFYAFEEWFRGGLTIACSESWGAFRVYCGTGGAPWFVDYDPATGKELGRDLAGQSNRAALRNGVRGAIAKFQ